MKRAFSHAIVTLFFCGDIMTGRGIDQILPQSAPVRLFEAYVRDARRYVELAEEVNGPIPRRVDFSYVWGDALAELQKRKPAVKIVNLETSLTDSGEPWPGKAVHYRMHPANAPLLNAAGIDVCALANNHVLDWGYGGLEKTLDTLRKVGIQGAGAGRSLAEAEAPAVAELSGERRVIVFSLGATSSGIPETWAAAIGRPGVNLLPQLSTGAVDRLAGQVRQVKRPGDLVVVSIHWGGNWGYEIADEVRRFAHLLVDRAAVDLVHGHSSHHVKGIEVYRGKLILYGCGDLVTDYEGIGGYEAFRGDLGLMYFPRLEPESGKLVALEMVPMQMRRFRLARVSNKDAAWLQERLNREGERLGTRVVAAEDGTLVLRWGTEETSGKESR